MKSRGTMKMKRLGKSLNDVFNLYGGYKMSILATILIIKTGASMWWFGCGMIADICIGCIITGTTFFKLS